MLFVIALMLAVTTAASAQSLLLPSYSMGPLPQTVPILLDGKPIGTATLGPGRAYLRDGKGELIGTLVTNPDGTRTFYDPNGKVLGTGDQIKIALPQEETPALPDPDK